MVVETMAFVSRPAFQPPQSKLSSPIHQLSMTPDINDPLLSSPNLLSSIAIPSVSLISTASSALLDPFFEAEVLADIAHVGLDLTQLIAPAAFYLRLAIVIGRLCAIGSDYLPDQYMNPEEIVFQTVMLSVASGGLLKTLLPILVGATVKTTSRDQHVHSQLFQPVGVTWTQYKAMVAVALDYVHIEPYQYLSTNDENDDECHSMYWLYAGNVQLRNSGEQEQTIVAGSGYRALLGELQFAQRLDSKKIDDVSVDEDSSKYAVMPTIQAGSHGATFVRIKTNKLQILMDHDPDLAESIRSMLTKGMHEKLSALMVERN